MLSKSYDLFFLAVISSVIRALAFSTFGGKPHILIIDRPLPCLGISNETLNVCSRSLFICPLWPIRDRWFSMGTSTDSVILLSRSRTMFCIAAIILSTTSEGPSTLIIFSSESDFGNCTKRLSSRRSSGPPALRIISRSMDPRVMS